MHVELHPDFAATDHGRRAQALTRACVHCGFCLATGPSKEAVMRIHERAGHPTPDVYELTVEV